MAQKDQDQEGGFKVKPAGPGGFEPAKPPPHAKDDEKGPPRHAQDDKDKPPKKPEEKGHESAGKSPLRTSPDARPVDAIAPELPKKEMKGDEAPQAQLYSPLIPEPKTKENAYQDHMVDAVGTLYPNMRDGVDFSVGRKEIGGPVEILYWSDKFAPADIGKVEELAKKMAAQDPYVEYEPKRGMHRGFAPPGTEGEHIPMKEGGATLPRDVAQSEVNPQSNIKHPTQPYQPVDPPEAPEAA